MTIRLISRQPQRQLFLNKDDMGEIRVDVKLTNAFDEERAAAGLIPPDQIRSTIVESVVDTGAVRSVVPQFVLDQFGVRKVGKEVAGYADGRREVVDLTAGIVFEILGRRTTDEALVLGDEVLIGQTILEKLDLLADCRNRQLVPNPDHPNQPVTKII
jgi:clan AA aspartic protease